MYDVINITLCRPPSLFLVAILGWVDLRSHCNFIFFQFCPVVRLKPTPKPNLWTAVKHASHLLLRLPGIWVPYKYKNLLEKKGSDDKNQPLIPYFVIALDMWRLNKSHSNSTHSHETNFKIVINGINQPTCWKVSNRRRKVPLTPLKSTIIRRYSSILASMLVCHVSELSLPQHQSWGGECLINV